VLLPFPIRTKEARERKRKKMGRGEWLSSGWTRSCVPYVLSVT
jgi:hypothetical protein